MNQRPALKNDLEISIAFPPIKNSRLQLLLTYDASAELHNKGLKERIIAFLTSSRAQDIEAYMNACVYFKLTLKEYSVDVFQKLNDAFATYMAAFEKENQGKIFWAFHYILRFPYTETHKKAGITGKGNVTFYSTFKTGVNELASGYP